MGRLAARARGSGTVQSGVHATVGAARAVRRLDTRKRAPVRPAIHGRGQGATRHCILWPQRALRAQRHGAQGHGRGRHVRLHPAAEPGEFDTPPLVGPRGHTIQLLGAPSLCRLQCQRHGSAVQVQRNAQPRRRQDWAADQVSPQHAARGAHARGDEADAVDSARRQRDGVSAQQGARQCRGARLARRVQQWLAATRHVDQRRPSRAQPQPSRREGARARNARLQPVRRVGPQQPNASRQAPAASRALMMMWRRAGCGALRRLRALLLGEQLGTGQAAARG
eukprot:84443-Prymnesium_polylepis.2